MSQIDLDHNAILMMLQNPEQYKKTAKPYKQAIAQLDMKTMLVMTEVIQQSLQRQHQEKPMILLNGIRFIKETLDKNSPTIDYSELVAERILPEMAITAAFDKEKKEDDRGKFYFNEKPSNELAILGNSFFRLVLECLLVWAVWFPNTVYAETFVSLLDQGVTFPDQLNYFKEENEKRLSSLSQNQLNSSQRNTALSHINNNKPPSQTSIAQQSQIQQQGQGSAQSIQPQQQQQQQPQQQVKSILIGMNLNVQRSGEFSKILVQVLVQFQKVKENVRTNLLNEQLNLDQFNYSIAEIKQYSQDFKILIERAQHIETSPSFEQHLSRLFNESEFSDNFLADIQAYKQKSITFEEIRHKYTIIIKPLRTQNSMSPSNQNNEEDIQSFNDYNKNAARNNNYMNNGDQVIESQQNQKFQQPNKFTNNNNNNNNNNYRNEQQVEEEEKYNQQNNPYGNKRFDGNNNYTTPTPNNDSERNNHHQNSQQYNMSQRQQLQQQQQQFPNNNIVNNNNDYNNNQYNSQIRQDSDLMGSSKLTKKQSFKHLFEQNDMEKYKLEMRSGSSYRKMSPSPSNQSSYYSSSLKSAIIRKTGTQSNGIDSQISLQRESEEVTNLKKQLEFMEKDRNMWKQKYEELQLEFNKINQFNSHQ